MSLARLLMKEQETLKGIDVLRAVENDLFNTLSARQQGLMDLTIILLLRAHIKTVGERLAAHTQTLSAVRQEIADARAKIVNAQQEKETLENLKAKEEAKWQLAEAAREARERDDIYIARAHRLQEADHV